MDDRSDGIILVMGVMGAGKSHFVNLLRGQSVVDGHLMISETQKCEAVQILIDEDEKRSITVVDTPGFLDTRRGQAEIVAEITDYLAAQNLSGLPRHLHLLRKIVGDDAFTNVILFTTMWNTFCNEDRQRALQREQELIGNF
ncbi:hypothetical protein BFJ66_g15496 [Fusarium oxysporum f. sp. cepae]|uniref:AIG1-type G domain-containing protein n=1 Tax=Fusarium oxysporum f. sp. cepae TaxID=396571 RepID=A0A3L6N074_FUSOX|nr:hypothetical protein BFJ65_g14746 [Fusarium oxysporum f. sp. cepae]RKK32175.1 hypothetical protein BFJ66_g15496 [Fusarium oxysporum f. sp. cepae]